MSPKPCDSRRTGPLFDGYCEENLRGENFFLYQIGLALGWAANMTLLIIIYSMASLFFFVRDLESRASRWVMTAQSGRLRNLVLAKSIMYIAVFLLIWIPSAIAISIDRVAPATIVAVLLPLQGFLNAFIHSGVLEKCCVPRPSIRSILQPSSHSGDLGSSSHVDENRPSWRWNFTFRR